MKIRRIINSYVAPITVESGRYKVKTVTVTNDDLKFTEDCAIINRTFDISDEDDVIMKVENINYEPTLGRITFTITTWAATTETEIAVFIKIATFTNTMIYHRTANLFASIKSGATSVIITLKVESLCMPPVVRAVSLKKIESLEEEGEVKSASIYSYDAATGKISYKVTMAAATLTERIVKLKATVKVLVDTTTIYTYNVGDVKQDIMLESLTVDKQSDYDIFGDTCLCNAAKWYKIGNKKLSELLYAPNKAWHIKDKFNNGYFGDTDSGTEPIYGIKEWAVPRPFETVIENESTEVSLTEDSSARILGTYQYRFGTKTVDSSIESTVKIWYDSLQDTILVLQEDTNISTSEVDKRVLKTFDKNSIAGIDYTPRVLTAILCGGGGYGGGHYTDGKTSAFHDGGGGGAVGVVAINLENTSEDNPIIVKLGNYGSYNNGKRFGAGNTWISDIQISSSEARTVYNSWFFYGGNSALDNGQSAGSLGGGFNVKDYAPVKIHLIGAARGGDGKSFSKSGQPEATARSLIEAPIFGGYLNATIPLRYPRESGQYGGAGGPSLGSGGRGTSIYTNGKQGDLGGGGGGAGGTSNINGEGGRGALVLLY